ncbi:MAG: TfoX/Sxy family protein [Candidatus Methanomethylophilaceae archaeon]|nr:TfoX/Sxy family protein [Candidatus Methanomethylophilaceae archaeon]
MSSSPEYVEFVAEQLAGAGNITYRKMFGEYGIYCDGKFFGCVCDNQFFVKITDPGREFMPDGETAPPYAGAKPCFLIEELDDPEFLKELTQITCAAIPVKKPGTTGRRTASE